MADVFSQLLDIGINKRILHPGKGEIGSFPEGTKTTFHYRTLKCDEKKTVLDDSRSKKPMELIVGKKFKLEVWEDCVKSMKVGEVAEFLVEPILAAPYPVVAKSLRDIYKKEQSNHSDEDRGSSHCCAMMGLAGDGGLGYDDLNELIKEPQSLIFQFEMLKVERPGEYKTDNWIMTVDEKIAAIPKLREEGNDLYKQKSYEGASEKYAEAIGMLEQLLLREKPGEEEWLEINDRKIPLLLNYAQCRLVLEDYYSVIEHTTTVLQTDPDNIKGLFRRAKGHVGAWNPPEARNDFRRVIQLDPSLTKTVHKELAILDEEEKKKYAEDREKLQGKMFS